MYSAHLILQKQVYTSSSPHLERKICTPHGTCRKAPFYQICRLNRRKITYCRIWSCNSQYAACSTSTHSAYSIFPWLSVPTPVIFKYFKNTTPGKVGVFSSMLNLFLTFTNTFLRLLFFLAGLIPQLLQKSQKRLRFYSGNGTCPHFITAILCRASLREMALNNRTDLRRLRNTIERSVVINSNYMGNLVSLGITYRYFKHL